MQRATAREILTLPKKLATDWASAWTPLLVLTSGMMPSSARKPTGTFHPADLRYPVWQEFLPCRGALARHISAHVLAYVQRFAGLAGATREARVSSRCGLTLRSLSVVAAEQKAELTTATE